MPGADHGAKAAMSRSRADEEGAWGAKGVGPKGHQAARASPGRELRGREGLARLVLSEDPRAAAEAGRTVPGPGRAAKGPRGSPQPCQEEQGGEAGRGSLWVTGVETGRPERRGENCGSAVRSRPRPAGPAARGQSRQAAPSCRTQGNSVRADAPGTSGLCSSRRQLSPCQWVLHTAAHALGPCGPRPPP